MSESTTERLRQYIALITRNTGGIEAAKERLRPGLESGGLESMASDAKGASPVTTVLEKLETGREISQSESYDLEAIILPNLRPAVDIVDGKFTVTHPLWTKLSSDETLRGTIERTIPLIGRVELPGNTQYPYGGTGFVVGKNLLMTNRHVAEIFATGLGDRRLDFLPDAAAAVDFRRELGRPSGTALKIGRIRMIHPYWDMALLEVEGLPNGHATLELALEDARDLRGREIFVVGYPAFDGRNPRNVQDDLFRGNYGVKRLQPGELQGGLSTGSFGKLVNAATHDSSTLGGNSGSAVVDLASGAVLALHFGGLYQQQNFAVPAAALSRDSRVIAAGVKFVGGAAPGGANDWQAWWQRADATEASPASTGNAAASAATLSSASAPSTASPQVAVRSGNGSVSITVPLHITVSLGAPAAAEAVVAATESVATDAGLEAMREPFRDTAYESRTGYDAGFLNDPAQHGSLPKVTVPAPGAKDEAVLAPTKDGGTLLHYQNFSVAMHATRRLALFTASNVTKAPHLKRPDPAKDYRRHALAGIGENDQERWFADPRLDDKHQIPDVFFTKDRGAFDKGHIVRRDDVAWGETYELLRRANGDTYHVTNCSPQVAGFNRSANGEANWGDLENHVLSEAANERLCVFAGPVLDPNDDVFTGKGEGGKTLKARIPKRFWKVIVARDATGIAAYGFVLEQDLSDVDFEFTVPETFAPALTSLTDIEGMAGVVFDAALRAADQFETERGSAVAMRANVRRRRKRGG